jgi:tetratricopeptide (TPR) repeat protein
VRPRYRNDLLDVRHAHGYVVQTLADLGLAGLAVSLALLAAWLAAAARTTGPWRGARGAFGPERVGMLTLAAIVLTFGVHSFVDWTWFVPGNAVLALLCAGWVAARGPLAATQPAPDPLIARLRLRVRDPRPAALAAAAVLVGLVCAWTAFQPQRSVDAGDSALTALESKDLAKARAAADDARRINPLSVEPLYDRSAIELSAGRLPAARAALDEAVNLQPSNPEPWQRLAEFELYTAHRPRAALDALGPALYLDPRSPSGQALFLEATRKTGATP